MPIEETVGAIGETVDAGYVRFDATGRFHNPAHAAEWSDPGIDAAFERVWALVLSGVRPVRDP